MQASHFLIVLVFLFRIKIVFNPFFLFVLILSLYIFLVELYYSSFNFSENYIDSLFFLFNFIVCLVFYDYLHNRNLNYFIDGLFFSGLISFVGVLIYGFGLTVDAVGGRSIGTFNNPNQLGYFSVCLASASFLLYRACEVKKTYVFFLVILCSFLSIASLSKAAMIPIALLIPLVILPRSVDFIKISVACFVFLIFLSIFLNFYHNGYLNDIRAYHRLSSMFEESDSSLESRGYFAFTEGNELQFLFGLGRENVRQIVGHEVHSTLWSVFNCYGLVGFSIFLWGLITWAFELLKSFGFVTFCGTWFPPMLYGLFHNGSRFTFFWILLALSFALISRKRAYINF